MTLPVELTDLARQDIEAIADYLSLNWSEEVKINFLVELTENINRIAEMP